MNDKEYEIIMAQIDGLMDAKPNTPEEAELVRLSKLVEEYEDEHYPIEEPKKMPPKIIYLDDAVYVLVKKDTFVKDLPDAEQKQIVRDMLGDDD